MKPSARPAAGMHLLYLDGAGILFSEAAQELHLLNATAAVIWSLLEEGHDADSAAAALGRMYGLDAERSGQFVGAALVQWREQGFLEGSLPPARDAASIAPATGEPVAGPPWHPPACVDVRHYRILGSRFRLCYSSVAQVRMVHPIVEHLEVPASSQEATAVDIVETMAGSIVYRDRECFGQCAELNELAPIVKSLVWSTSVNNRDYFLNIHAGVVGDGSRCILLPAPRGSGKSTLTASLVHAGYRFFSDEVALLEAGSLDVVPVPLAICVKSTGIDALADRFPGLRELPLHQRTDGKQVAYMAPPPGSHPADDAPCPVHALVFPRYAPDESTALVRLPKPDALKRLLEECLAVPTPLDLPKVEALVKWIARIPCYSLSYESTDAAIAEVESVFPASAIRA